MNAEVRPPHGHSDEDHARRRDPEDERRPPEVRVPGRVHEREVAAESDCCEDGQADARGEPFLAAASGLSRREEDADECARHPRELPHFQRLVRRFGWTTEPEPDKIEVAVGALFPPKDWPQLCHNVIWHGRRRCHARNPACGACPIARFCPAYGEGETDPVKAAKLVREPRG